MSALVKKIKQLLNANPVNVNQVLQLLTELMAEHKFGYARQVLQALKTSADMLSEQVVKVDQQLAFCTYKDNDLPEAIRLNMALQILTEGATDLNNSNNAETLGLAGAIYKRKWMITGEKVLLERSLTYYLHGYQLNQTDDYGYTGINAAYVYDLLARQAAGPVQQPAGAAPLYSNYYKQQATLIRQQVIQNLTKLINQPEYLWLNNEWWFLVTLAEAHLGLKNYAESKVWLIKAMNLRRVQTIPSWVIESTTRQLAHIAILDFNDNETGIAGTEVWNVLLELTDGNADALNSCFVGKTGIALSGGGFRASLYHIGVLAKLAENDMLRHIEVISCVSGGSVIGTYYYLELKHLLETVPDNQITQTHYITIVKRIITNFLSGVQSNIRTLVIANWFSNFKMLFRNYSRTERVGELYESELFSRINDGKQNQERWLHDLWIHPADKSGNKNKLFNIKYDNWHRKAKVPVLVLNATTLNTGHNWQFTASWMGESPLGIQKIDSNYRLRRIYYAANDSAIIQKPIRLGHAVAASACVPGLFEPLSLTGLYNDINVRLVDGGVHDNQGIFSLFEQDCNVLLVSDASGQMCARNNPSASSLGVSLRANDILMERVRHTQYQHIKNLSRAGILRSYLFLHLKLNLQSFNVNSLIINDLYFENLPNKSANADNEGALTSYNIRKDVQMHLSAIRTDLDAFSNIEAWALMCSGYQMAGAMVKRNLNRHMPPVTTEPVNWSFLAILPRLQNANPDTHLNKILSAGKNRFFKVWLLFKWLKVISIILLVMAAAAVAFAAVHFASRTVMSIGQLGAVILVIVCAGIICKMVVKAVSYREVLSRFITGLGLITVGWIIANLHLMLLNKLYLKAGKVKVNIDKDDVSS